MAGQTDQTAVIRVRGTTGTEQIRVYTDTDVLLFSAPLETTEWTEFQTPVPANAEFMYVAFVNDGRTATGADRNVLVDKVTWLDTQEVVQAETVESMGVWNGVDCGVGFRQSQFLACNGWFKFPVPDDGSPPPPPPPDDGTITVTARGWTGSEVLQLEVDGDVVDQWTVSASAATHTFDYSGPAAEVIRVNFVNDGVGATGRDRNVAVSQVTYGDQVFDPIDVRSKGVWNGTDCGIGFRQSQILACNGWFEFIIDPTNPPPPPPPGDGLITVTARGWTGSEIIQLEINGDVVEEWGIFAGSETYAYDYSGPAAEVIRVNFVNDGNDATGRDRNVAVSQVTYGDQVFDPIDVRSKGVWNGTDCGIGFRQSQVLACNGWFEFIIDPTDPPPPPPTDGYVSVQLRGATGTESVFVSAGEVTSESFVAADTETVYTFEFSGVFDAIRINFENDGFDQRGRDRNVFVDWVEVNGFRAEAETLLGKGVWDGSSCTRVDRHDSRVLACNGWFEFQDGDGVPVDDGGDGLVAPAIEACDVLSSLPVPGDDATASTVTRYIWSDESTAETNYFVETDRDVYLLPPDSTSYVIETLTSDPESVVAIGVTDGEFIADTLVGTDCRQRSNSPIAPEAAPGDGAGSVAVAFWEMFAADAVDYYTVDVFGETYSFNQRAVADDDSRAVAVFDGVPADEVQFVTISSCYSETEPNVCFGVGRTYHQFGGFYLAPPAGTAPSNPALGAPTGLTGVAVGPWEIDLSWDAPAANDNQASTLYQVRSFDGDTTEEVQEAWGALSGVLDSLKISDTSHRYRLSESTVHQFEVRACNANGCGPWSQRSAPIPPIEDP